MRRRIRRLFTLWAWVGAFSPELAFGARTPPERGELIGGHLMIEYYSRISLFSYFICKKSIKTLIKSLKWTQVDPETKSPLCINRLSLFGRAKKVFDNVQITMVLHPSLLFPKHWFRRIMAGPY